MKRIITLTESDLTRIVRRVMKETVMQPEPVDTNEIYYGRFYFDTGDASLSPETRKNLVNNIVNILKITGTKKAIDTFINTPYFTKNMKDLFKVIVGTSSSGSDEANSKVKIAREELMKGVIKDALLQIGYRLSKVDQILTTTIDTGYEPTKLNFDLFDPKKFKDLQEERFAYIEIQPHKVAGSEGVDLSFIGSDINTRDIQKYKVIQNEPSLINLWGLIDPGTTTVSYIVPNEQKITSGIKKLKSYSDITEMNQILLNIAKKDLAGIVNNKVTNQNYFNQICNHLKNVAESSDKDQSVVYCKKSGSNNYEPGTLDINT